MFSFALKSFSSNITANYTISNNPTTFAGAWKVFDGKNKKTGKVVSIFVFDRKSLEPSGGGSSLRSRSNGASRRKLHDEVVERLKKEANSLARLRHPNILELAEPVEDTRNGGLMFATEPITATLASLLQSQDEQDRGRGRSSRAREDDAARKEPEIDELEIQKGLLQVAKGLEFLHESAGLVHGNITPDAIYINAKSDWKLSGLAFSGPPDVSNNSTPSTAPPIALSELLYHDPRLPRSVQLNLDYTSPDFVMDTNISASADIFSLGLVILALYNSPHESPIHTGGNVSTYKKLFSSSSTVPSANNNFLSKKPLPRDLVSGVLPRLITRRPAQRMNAREFQESRFFDNVLVSAIRFLESLPAKTPNEKAQFMRGLPRFIDQFPKSVLDRKVLPALLEETKDKELLSLILGNVFKIVGHLPSAQRTFTDVIVPKLREIFITNATKSNERDSAKEAGLGVVLENMPLITQNCAGKSFKDDILPIVISGLESPTHAIVDKSLGSLSTMLTILDFSTIKNEVFPVVATVFSKTSSLAIKVKGLEAFVILCGGGDSDPTTSNATASAILDKYTVQEKVVPLIKAMKTKEPAVMMASLAVFRQIGQIVDYDFLAMEVLPVAWTFALGPLLNLQQFQEYMGLIKQFSSKVEQEQTRKLRDLASSNAQDSRSSAFTPIRSSHDPFAAMNSSSTEADFEALVLGKPTQQSATTQNNFASPTWPTSPNTASSRAITPDHTAITTLNAAFPPVQPVSTPFPGINGPTPRPLAAPLQPTSMAATNPWASPPQTSNPNMNNSVGGNMWTIPPPQSSMSSLNSMAQPPMNNMGGAWNRPSMPAQQNLSMNSLNSLAAMNQSRPPGGGMALPLQPKQAGGIAPPPNAGMNMGFGQTGQKPANQGLDTYDSLI